MKYITTQEMVAYLFTKPIPKEAYFRHVKFWAYVDIKVYLRYVLPSMFMSNFL